jgi:hypothetical protein
MNQHEEDIDLVEGRLEGLQILLETPENEKMMTNAELKYAIAEVKIILSCLKITRSSIMDRLCHPGMGNALLLFLILFNLCWDLFVAIKSGWL